MMRASVAAVLLGLSAGSAAATGSIACEAPDGSASLELTIGSLPVLGVVNATIVTPKGTRSMQAQDGDAIRAGQAFRDGETLLIDFTDANVERVVAGLRLFTTVEGSDAATAGTLLVAGEGAWPVVCTGP